MASRRHQLTIDWRDLEWTHQVSPCCWWWVDDASIADALRSGRLDDLSQPWGPHTHQAERVAAIVRLIQQGASVTPLDLELDGDKAHLHDGHHRLRAYQYLGLLRAVPVEITIT